MLRRRCPLAAAVLVALALAAPAHADVGQARTTGPQYDRNPSVVQDGALTYMFFARSILPCNRLAGCNPDLMFYDLYYKVSSDGGKSYGPAALAAQNPAPGLFYGRTVAATRTVDSSGQGALYVFWASGGNNHEVYWLQKTGTGFTAPAPVTGSTTPMGTFNVEAVSLGTQVYLYTEECCVGGGIYAHTFDAGVASNRTLVALGMNIPKAIVDNQPDRPRFRMTMVEASGYPTVDVYVSSSADGLVWSPPVPVVHEDGVSHWDPNLAQLPNGRYYLHFAPDEEQGAGRQRIGVTTSNDFASWSAPHEVSPGYTGGTEYWDYWPEGFVLGNKLTLYYTSERGFDASPTGVAHIWTNPGFSGQDAEEVTTSTAVGPFASWTSAPIAVVPGATYVVAADALGSGGRVVVEQLTAAGPLATAVDALPLGFVQTVDDTVTIAGGVTSVRVRLVGGLAGTSFSDVRLWQQ
jgi:hypothetical protein